MLLVKHADVSRALTSVQPRLMPAQFWSDAEEYLKQRQTEDVLKVLDFGDSWEPSIRNAAMRVLANRGISYPPEGVVSFILPACCLVLSLWLGPFAGIALRWRIDKTVTTTNGGNRPYYDLETQRRANRAIVAGFTVWCLFCLFALGYRFSH